jgi:hypothetical protein
MKFVVLLWQPINKQDLSRNSDITRKAHLFDFPKHSNEILADKFLQVGLCPATGTKQFSQQVGVTGHILQAEGCAGNTSAVSKILQRTGTKTYKLRNAEHTFCGPS